MKRVAETFMVILGLCVVVRVIAWLITPALPMLVVVTLLAAVSYRVIGGPRFKGSDRFF